VYSDIISFIDWDFFKSPSSIAKVSDIASFPEGEKEIVLQRDDEYNLTGKLYFQDKTFFQKIHDERNKENVAGKVYDGFDVIGSYSNNALISLKSCRLGGLSYPGGKDFLGSADLNFNELNIKFTEKAPTRLREWYLNGPSQRASIESAEQKILRQCSKERFLSNEKLDLAENFGPCCLSKHYLWGKNSDYKFLLAKVPIEESKWSTNIQIEYHKDWGKIPEPDERLKIEELCSFVFGKHLLSLGYTAYDSDENIVEVYAHSPWGQDAKTFCSQPEYPPIRIHDYPPGDAEKIVNFLLPKYAELNEMLCLQEALWNYWISFDIPVGTNLPIIASALETIIDNWYKSKNTKSRGFYLDPEKFEEIIKDNVLDLKGKLEGIENGQKIIDNVRRANAFGIMERYRKFFEEIELRISPVEWEAIMGRHAFVHGHVHFDTTDWKQVIRQVNTLHTLFNRTLLKILGYKWDYIDRSVEGWPDAKLG
jgi:hypothetical protein